MPNKKRKSIKNNKPRCEKNDFIESIKKAVENLTYMSETDAELEPFAGIFAADVTKEEILRQTGHSATESIQEKSFTEVFDNLTKIQDWYGEEERLTAEKFIGLKNLLEKNLKNLRVFKIGQINLEVFFVGLDSEGKLVGVKTAAVET